MSWHHFPIWDDIGTFIEAPWRGFVDVVSGGFLEGWTDLNQLGMPKFREWRQQHSVY